MSPAACPACVAVPPHLVEPVGDVVSGFDLSVPGVHCAGCIRTIEAGLRDVDGVLGARVNLSLKRLSIRSDGRQGLEAQVRATLENMGFEAFELDAKTLAARRDPVGRDLLVRLGVAGFAAMNVMLLSVSVWAGADGATRDFLHWVSAGIALPTTAFAAQPFFKSAWSALRGARLNMDVPISLAILLACAMSLYETSQGGENAYFDAALSLTFFLLAGRYLDHQTRAKARSAAVELSALDVPKAQLIKDGRTSTVQVEALVPGDRVLVRPGARIPVDGVVVDGTSALDMSLLTGETMPAAATTNTPVYAGILNINAPLEVEVTTVGRGTKLAQIAALVAAAEATKTTYTALADRAAQIYAPVVHLLALAAFVGWQWATGDTRLAIGVATAVLIITCPCALGLAAPAVMTAATGRLYRAGILLRDGVGLERLGDIDTVVFDKTGTLTTGEMSVLKAPSGDALAVAAGLAQRSDHPLSAAIRGMAGIAELPEITQITEYLGVGIEGIWNHQIVRLGRAGWIGVAPFGDLVQTWVQIGERPPQVFLFEDRLKDSAAPAIDDLKARGLRVVMLSGDTQGTTDLLAQKLGIDEAVGGVLPDQKLGHIARLGARVLMVGDGLNDTAALAGAHVSISPAKAIDAARAASDFVLVKDDLRLIGTCLDLARAAKRRMLENFAIAAAYNAVAIPIALAGLATPLLAALAMSASSICVSLNALRLTREG